MFREEAICMHDQGNCHGVGMNQAQDQGSRDTKLPGSARARPVATRLRSLGSSLQAQGPRGGSVLHVTPEAMKRGHWRHLSPESGRRSRVPGGVEKDYKACMLRRRCWKEGS